MADSTTPASLGTGPMQPDHESSCDGGELVVVMVRGTSMEPEFTEGDVAVIEPDGAYRDGSFVLAQRGNEWVIRRLEADGVRWRLAALNPAFASVALTDLSSVRGVVIQKAKPGRRRATKHYI